MNFLKRAWRGEAKLWQIFWLGVAVPQLTGVVVGLIGGFVIGSISAANGTKADPSQIKDVVASLPWFLTFLVYYCLLIMCVWRCRRNTGHAAWSWAALAVLIFFTLSLLIATIGKLAVGDAPQPVLTQDVSDGSI